MSTPSALLIDRSLSKERDIRPFSIFESVETASPVRLPTSFSVRPSLFLMARMVSPGVGPDAVSFGRAEGALMRGESTCYAAGKGFLFTACHFQKRNLLSDQENH